MQTETPEAFEARIQAAAETERRSVRERSAARDEERRRRGAEKLSEILECPVEPADLGEGAYDSFERAVVFRPVVAGRPFTVYVKGYGWTPTVKVGSPNFGVFVTCLGQIEAAEERFRRDLRSTRITLAIILLIVLFAVLGASGAI